MGCGGSDDQKEEAINVDQTTAPTAADMEKAKILYVKLKANWESGVEGCPTSIDQMRMGLGDGGLTKPWMGLPGLRHKYFGWDEEAQMVCGVYVWYDQTSLDEYKAGELFASHEKMPHFSWADSTVEVHDVLVGTENSIENYNWPNTPPTRDDVTGGAMLVVRLDIDLGVLAGAVGLPEDATDEQKEGAFFMNFKAEGMNYCGAAFGKESGPKGLRGKYFTWNAETKVCSGFYTFVTRAELDEYMESDLFKTQADPPFISMQSATVYEVLPGTEITIDQGSWGK